MEGILRRPEFGVDASKPVGVLEECLHVFFLSLKESDFQPG